MRVLSRRAGAIALGAALVPFIGAWLATTAQNECLRNIATRRRLVLVGEEYGLELIAGHEQPVDEALLAAERASTVREALKALPHHWQRLMELLMATLSPSR